MVFKMIQKKTILPLAAAVILAGGFTASQAHAAVTVIYEENFDNINTGGKPQGFEFKEDNGKVIVVEAPGGSGKSLYWEDKDASGNYQQRAAKKFDKAYTGVITVEFDFMLPDASDNTRLFRLVSESGAAAISVETTTDDNIVSVRPVKNGKWNHLITGYELNKWYKLKIVANTETQKADYYIDGKLLGEQLDFIVQVDNIAQFDSFTPGGSAKSHYIDSIKITHGVPEAAPEAPAKPTAPAAPAEPAAAASQEAAPTEPVIPSAMPKTGMGGASETTEGASTAPMWWMASALAAIGASGGILLRRKALKNKG